MIKKDENGMLSIIDGIFSITLVFIVFSLFNLIIVPIPTDYSENIKDSQDIMELLSNKVNFQDKSVLDEAEFILRSNNNSKKAIDEVAILIKNFFNDLNLKSNYLFTENNYLKGEPILNKGNINNVENISVASRNIGNYSFVLYLESN